MKIYLIAGEASGDLLGSQIIHSLKAINPAIELKGVGGDLMASQGFSSLFPMHELSIMGLFEIIPHIPQLLTRINDVVKDIEQYQPHIIVTIDAPGFTFRVAKKIKRLGIKLVHVTAPTVWAWRPGRAKTMARVYDHLFCLFPFEPPYFEVEGLATTFMGHPLVNLLKPYERPYDPKGTLCLLPGSRKAEINTMMPLFCELLRQDPSLANHGVILPTLPHFQPLIQSYISELPIKMIMDPSEKYSAIASSRLALAASGTVTLELGLLGIPMIVGYKTHPVTAFILKHLVHTPYASLVNILLDQDLVPEYLQEKCTIENFSKALYTNKTFEIQREFFPKLKALVTGKNGIDPSTCIADYLSRQTY